MAAADAACESRAGRTNWKSFILLGCVDLPLLTLVVGVSIESRVGAMVSKKVLYKKKRVIRSAW